LHILLILKNEVKRKYLPCKELALLVRYAENFGNWCYQRCYQFPKNAGFDMRNDFTMFKRAVPSGAKVVYYYAYDENGVRKGPWTTKCLNFTEARNYCHRLIRNGVLVPNKVKTMTFSEFANGFWELDSEFIRNERSRKDFNDSYVTISKQLSTVQIEPFFGKLALDKITCELVNKWLLGFKDRGKIDKKTGVIISGYKNSYANAAFRTLNVMMTEAVKRGLIQTNPCDKVERLKNNKKKIDILKIEEVRALFPKDYKTVWGDKEIAYAANLLASITGMRIGEVMGLRGEFVFDNYIAVCGQYGSDGYRDFTKTKVNRSIPLMPEMIALLRKLMIKNSNGYVFSLNGGAVPATCNYFAMELNKALNKIGISKEEIKNRGLTLHGWRHFLNNELQRQGLTISQVQSVTGHKSERMTEWYNHPDPMNVPNVTKAQAAIFVQEDKIEQPEPMTKQNIRSFTPMKKPEKFNRKRA